MYSESMKNIANVSPPRRKLTTFAPVSVRRRVKIPSGTSGAFERCSTARKATWSTAEATRMPIVCAERPAVVFACVSA